MSHKTLKVVPFVNRLGFSVRLSNKNPWWRDLDLDGEPLFRIGNTCDTCEAMFNRSTSEAKLPIEPPQLAQLLRTGLSEIQQPILDTLAFILPKGDYAVGLFEIRPQLVTFKGAGQFLWENSQPVKAPSDWWPTAPRFRPWMNGQPVGLVELAPEDIEEAVLPIVAEDQLNQDTIASYQSEISKGVKPTALSLSVVDERFISGRAFDLRLVHFLLDGHHKMMAASNLGQPITLLSFLNVSESFAREDWIERILQIRY